MRQTRLMSVVEISVTRAATFVVAWLAQPTILAFVGVEVSYGQALLTTPFFVAISLVISYVARRYFNRVCGRSKAVKGRVYPYLRDGEKCLELVVVINGEAIAFELNKAVLWRMLQAIISHLARSSR